MRKEKRANKKLRKKVKIKKHNTGIYLLLIPLGLALIIGIHLYYFLCTSPVFCLSRIEIRSNGSVDQEKVKECAGLTDSTRIFDLNLDKVSRKIEALPRVKKAAVSKVFPDRLIVEIRERKPIGRIKSGRCYFVDSEGVILLNAGSWPAADLPLLAGIGFRKNKISIGRRYESKRLDQVLKLLKAVSLSTRLAIKDIDLVNARAAKDVTLTTRKGLKIILGNKEFKDKIQLLDRVLKDIYDSPKKVRSIDLRFGDVIVKH
ncbi:MAG: FtsQ-type POTRA domain-containing protein [Candidatus Omnitrophota bacterium]|nr:FtsQ-type POTRA domain-containing protein [Candidatus Omnitrophota bacterium]